MNPIVAGTLSAKEHRLPHRRVVMFVIALALAAIAALAWKVIDDRQKELAIFRSEFQLQSQALSGILETSFDSVEQMMSGLTHQIDSGVGPIEERLDLRGMLLRSPSLLDLRFYGTNGILVTQASLMPLTSPVLPDWVAKDVARGRVTGFGHTGEEFAIYRVVRGSNGHLSGTVIATISKDYFQSIAEQIPGAAPQASFLIGPDNRLVLDFSDAAARSDLDQTLQFIDQVGQGFTSHGSRFLDIGDTLLVIQQLKIHPIRLIQAVSKEDALARWHAEVVQSAAMASVVALAALMFVLYWLRSAREHQRLMSDLHQMNMAIEQTPASVVITDLEARIQYVNPRFTAVTGYSRAEALGQNPRMLHSGQTSEAVYRDMWEKLTRGLVWHGELLNKRKNEELYWEEMHVAPVKNPQGAVTHYVAVKIDISERKRVEAALLESQRDLMAAQRVAHLGNWSWDIRTDRHTWSDEIYAIYGHPQALGPARFPQVQTYFTQPSWASLSGAVQKCLIDGTSYECDAEVVRPDGSHCWVVVFGKAVVDEDGGVMSLYGTVQDITERKQVEERINELNRDFVSFLENTSDFIYFKDADSRFRFCSQTLANITNHANWRDMVGKHDLEVFPKETAQIYYEEELPIFRDGKTVLNKIDPFFDALGNKGWVSTNKWPLRDSAGNVIGLFGISRDITEHRLAEEKLTLAANVFTYAREGIAITDSAGAVIDVNSAFTRITGYARDEVLGKNLRLLNAGRQSQPFYVDMWHELLGKGFWSGEMWNRRKNGEVYAEMLTISAVRDFLGLTQQYVGLFSDVTALKEHEQQLERIAHFDTLTALPNRVLLADRLHQAMAQVQRRGQRLAVAFLDLDGFKSINDSHGHAAGDQLLMGLAIRMKQSLREGDTLARMGGDEFVAILVDLDDVADSVPMLNRLLAAAAESVQFGDLELKVSASLGVTFYPQTNDIDADTLLRQADLAMYQAKLSGKNQYHVFDADQDRQ